ncbi:MAG: phospho-N-acetylmuramoyl-pentapeptide-transferase [Acidaminococcus sp.]|jgi:phospho-N-acetylmuramoyl-pentapeptide-transferase|nr:phospho-N-acetylmuramoyl-pentapeptide-transferase [Acidaminococcus sp.]MCI2100145.1 phospho-N-acetylmuramoyl-pentapeptide-transferase [Acidaminococcus sp.]MCI2114464.1 phospho-N-acetylmuramoyl-pentapeptide-transferase [Acidaminococcus sp.]MCI2116399.1 phospho-N-acetylmuramoyl-pentapeptide-transferase [Acidaminococcus sp.]
MNEFWIVITSFALTVIIGKFLIPELHKWHFGQSIRECGPKEHMKKSGTPTMGGIMMIIAVVVACLMWIPFDPHIVVALWLFVGYGLIGFIDDGLKVFFKQNLGLTAKQKMALQVLVAAVYLLYPGDVYSTKVWVPLINTVIDLGYFYPVFILLLLVGTTNAVNLTDGLDGLAAGVTIPVMLAFAAIASFEGLRHESLFSLALAGACIGFLRYNHFPAKVFMGDTGSLALGGAVAAAAIGTHTEILLVLIGGVYVIETVSVIMQVLYFKKTGGKRIFRMTPIHHHFELGGWPETTVVARFCLASAICSAAGFVLFLLK